MLAFQPAFIAAADIVPPERALAEMTLGKKDAPVTMIEYASLGCPHCAAFHSETLPTLKKEYIDTGKLRLIYRDFPLGTPALAAAMIAHCAGPEKYFGFVEIFFRSQAQWAHAQDPLPALAKVARFGGMSQKDVDQCLKSQPILAGIRQIAAQAQEQYQVNSTPTFIIGKEVINGAMPYAHFKKAIDKALGE